MDKYKKQPIVVEIGKKKDDWITRVMKENTPIGDNTVDLTTYGAEQVFIKNFYFSAEEMGFLNNKMENAVWQWLSSNDPYIVSSSQTITVKDGKFHINMTIFYKLPNFSIVEEDEKE